MFYTDTEALSFIVNKQTSRTVCIMFLVRKLVLLCLGQNIEFKARHFSGKFNHKADSLSRLQVDSFKQQSPYSDILPTTILERFLPQNYCKGLLLC